MEHAFQRTPLPLARQRAARTARAFLARPPDPRPTAPKPGVPGVARGPGDRTRPGGDGPVRSLYVHVPFCVHKCHYCDFYSIVDTRDRQEAFTDRLIRELAAIAPWSAGAPLRTIFVGGGTPSLLRVDLWRRLLDALERHFDLSAIRAEADVPRAPGAEPAAEFSVECNPESVGDALMDTLRAGGVPRGTTAPPC